MLVLTRKVSRELGLDFKEVGELIVSFNDSDRSRLVRIKNEAEMLGVAGLKIVGRSWLKKNEPNLSSKVVEALYAPTAGIISPYRLVYGLSENAVKNGVEVYVSSEVEDISYLNNPGQSETLFVFPMQPLHDLMGKLFQDSQHLISIVNVH